MNAALAHVESRTWRRFTPRQRLSRFAIYFALVVAIVLSLRSVEVIPEFLYDAPEQVKDLLTRMWPIAWSHYPAGVHGALMETLHIATLGTILAVAMALPVGILAAHNVVPSRPLNYAAWKSVFSEMWFQVGTMLFVASLLYHAWVGMRDILMDYIKPTGIRLTLQFGVAFVLLFYLVWTAAILWGR